MSVAITATDLEKSFGTKKIFDKLNLKIPEGKITAVVGPNGAGKSTLFNIIAKLLAPDSGHVTVEDYNQYKFSYVFQNHRESLLPWRTNLENIAFPLQLQGISTRERKARASQMLKKHRLCFLATGYPYELSGGQQQMLALMRALVTGPELLLLDEPFAALDYGNTLRMRNILQDYYAESRATVFIITHDIEEAVQLASNVIVLSTSPTQVLGKIENNLPYPRTVETLQNKAFHKTTSEVLSVFRESVSL